MTHKRIDDKTPNGGDYSEIYFFDDNNNPIEESKATRCIIRECKSNGELINEIFGTCN